MIRHRAGSPSPAVTDAELQADVMRFVAILALCLVAVSSLVDGYRASARPEDDSLDTAAPVPAEIERIPESASSRPSPANPMPQKTPDPPPIRQTVEISPPVPESESEVSGAATPPAAAHAAKAPGLALRFLTDAALLRLVARGEVGVYVTSESQTFALDLSDGIEFRESPPPAQFYAMAAETVPAVLKASYPGAQSGQWGVTLPRETSRSIEAFLAADAAGELIIDAHGRVSLERHDE